MKRARVHHAARRRGGGVAARGARAAAGDAAHRRVLIAEDDRRDQGTPRDFGKSLSKLGWSRAAMCASTIALRPAALEAQALAKELVALRPDVILAHSRSGRGRIAAGDQHDPDRVRQCQ